MLVAALFIEISIAVIGTGLKAIESHGPTLPGDFGSPGSIGELLLERFLVVFEAASMLLLIAAVGAIVLAGRRSATATSPRSRPDGHRLVPRPLRAAVRGRRRRVLIRRSPLVILLCLELMLNAGNLALVAFARSAGNEEGQVFALVVMVVAACEVVIGLGLIVAMFRRRLALDVDAMRELGMTDA